MQEIIEKAKQVKCLISDLDGVLTDGYLVYGSEGEALKYFHVHDGFGMKLLMLSGIQVVIITTADTPIVDRRMGDLGIETYYTGQINKVSAYNDVLKKYNLSENEVACVGDDLPDLPMITRSGLGIAVANANQRVLDRADYVTQKAGGHGAVREICELLMSAQGTLDTTFDKYHDEHA